MNRESCSTKNPLLESLLAQNREINVLLDSVLKQLPPTTPLAAVKDVAAALGANYAQMASLNQAFASPSATRNRRPRRLAYSMPFASRIGRTSWAISVRF